MFTFVRMENVLLPISIQIFETEGYVAFRKSDCDHRIHMQLVKPPIPPGLSKARNIVRCQNKNCLHPR